jgi:signal transduction histidine kinase
LFNEPGEKGKNKEQEATIYWFDGTVADCHLKYYGQGSRNEYRITKLSEHFNIGDLVVIVKVEETKYKGFILSTKNEIDFFLASFNLNPEDTNTLIDTSKDSTLNFKPKARIILQLGDQLIRSESIAILEIIKNAYDACANKVSIELKNVQDPDNGEIIIEDDGWGMDVDTISNVWLQPGTTFKKKQIDDNEFISPCNRIPLGEKGIGRFGVHKLGEEIILISKTEESNEAYLEINWKDFDNDSMLDEVPIKLIERKPETFKSKAHGTKIIIKKLRSNWTRGNVRELYRAINSLNSPFEKLNSFKVTFKIDNQDWLSGLLSFKDIVDSSLFSATAKIAGNKIVKLEYNFLPWPTMKELRHRTHIEEDIFMSHKTFDEQIKKNVFKDIDLSKFQIGEVDIKMLIFDFDATTLSFGVQDKKGLKDYLKMNGGMRVYRDGVRVYDYGEPGNDWLNLDIERVNLPTARISNNIVIGAIELSRIQSKDLVEKTNREGFIENEAYKEFYDSIRFTLSRIITQRNIDKEKLRNQYKSGPKKTPVVDNLYILKEKVTNNLPESETKREILGMIQEIDQDYKTISEVYIRSASAGLSLSIVIHEIEKIIQELLYVVDETTRNDANSDRIKSLTWHLGKLIDGYSGLIRRRSKKESDLVQVVINALWNVEFRLRAHNVEIVNAYKEQKKFSTLVKCSDSLIIGTIVNIIDNSIWWLEYGKTQKKKLFIDISNELPNYVTLLIADNGPGFTLPPDDIIKPFISNKDGGIGIGLHIAHEIMNSHGGELIFPSPDQFTIPEDFVSGAIIGLAFPISKK